MKKQKVFTWFKSQHKELPLFLHDLVQDNYSITVVTPTYYANHKTFGDYSELQSAVIIATDEAKSPLKGTTVS